MPPSARIPSSQIASHQRTNHKLFQNLLIDPYKFRLFGPRINLKLSIHSFGIFQPLCRNREEAKQRKRQPHCCFHNPTPSLPFISPAASNRKHQSIEPDRNRSPTLGPSQTVTAEIRRPFFLKTRSSYPS